MRVFLQTAMSMHFLEHGQGHTASIHQRQQWVNKPCCCVVFSKWQESEIICFHGENKGKKNNSGVGREQSLLLCDTARSPSSPPAPIHISPLFPHRKQSLKTDDLAHYLSSEASKIKGVVKYWLQVMSFFFFLLFNFIFQQRKKQMFFRRILSLKVSHCIFLFKGWGGEGKACAEISLIPVP